ncbi:hypothetical protein BDN71DRAFT_1509007 [Pleurotus eryngii]|uniref:Uncharacterized protein n=1 Tax=Pleurotus eryngii TaxID=5323 RepID=A0A9P5ZR11_PLEER|nr:hypothetical protein BDN71DRAFT_1509007 [Pleurotus eryngii]
MQQELIVEIPVTKKPTRAKKDKNMTSADHDAADEEVNETTIEHLTVTARTLQESDSPLAPPARRVGTGVTLAPITPSITTSRIRHEEPEDVPQITTKDKGKGRDLTNLGLLDAEEEKDEGEDAEAEKSDEEGNEEKDADAGSNGDEDGELKKTDDEDNDEDNAAEVTIPADLSDNDEDAMEVDPTTPKCRASASPTTAHQMGKGLRKDITHASASSHRAFPSPMSDDLEDLQGASRTMGGFARGKAMGVALNMADFDTNKESDAPPVMGMLLVFRDGSSPLEGAGPVGVKVPIKNTLGPVLTTAAKKMVALTNSDILLWDAEDRFWEAKGPYATTVRDNEAVIWDDNNKLRIGMQPSKFGLSYLPPPSPSINSSATPSAVSSITPSASVSVTGTSAASVNPLITAFPNDPLLLQIATRMEVPLHMTNSGKGNGGLVNMYTRYQLANSDYNFVSEAHTKVWGGREVGRTTLGKVLDELEAEAAAEEARVEAEKAKKAKEAKKKAAKKVTK